LNAESKLLIPVVRPCVPSRILFHFHDPPMNNPSDVNPAGPPSLLSTGSDEKVGESSNRILAGLEGRVGKGAAAPAKTSRPRVAGVVAGIVVLGLAFAWWLKGQLDGEPTETLATAPPVAQPAPAAAPSVAAADASGATQDGASAPQVATIVNDPPAQTAQDTALDQLGKVSAAAATGAAATAAKKAADRKARAQAARDKAKADGEALRAKAADGKSKALAKKEGKESNVVAAEAARRAKSAKKPGALTADDPDADLLAALLTRPSSKKVAPPHAKPKTASATATPTASATAMPAAGAETAAPTTKPVSAAPAATPTAATVATPEPAVAATP
jgi:hypothetical protein